MYARKYTFALLTAQVHTLADSSVQNQPTSKHQVDIKSMTLKLISKNYELPIYMLLLFATYGELD